MITQNGAQISPPLTPTTVGIAGTQTAYVATGQKSPAVPKANDFTATRTESMDYEITAVGKVVTLLDADPVGTVYQFHNVGTGFAASPTVLDPQGATLINGAATYSFDRDNGSQYVRKVADGTWLASQ